MPRVTLAELQQYINDLELGVALRFDDLGARLDRIENDVAIIKEHLVTRMRLSGVKPNGSFGQPGAAGHDADALLDEDV